MNNKALHLIREKFASRRRVAFIFRMIFLAGAFASCLTLMTRGHGSYARSNKNLPARAALRTRNPRPLQPAKTVLPNALPTAEVELTAPPTPAKLTALSLTTTLTRAVAYVAKSTKAADKKLVDAKNKRQQPFFAALKKTDSNLKTLAANVKSKDDKKLFKTLARTGQSVNELEAAYGLSGIKDPKISEGVKKLVGAFKTFRKNFGKEALRKKQGGEVTAKESEQVKALTDKYRRTLAELTKLKASQSNAPGKGGLYEITRLINQLTALLNPGPASTPGAGVAVVSLAQFSRLLLFEEDFVGSWYAISSYESLVHPTSYAAYNVIDSYAADIYSYASTVESSFEFTSEEYWSYSESTSIETTESYEVSITESEISQSESYLESVSLDISVDAYDVTLGNEDVAFIDHDSDGIIDSKDDDDDNDGIPDAKDFDDDGDGIADIAEEDSDSDGAPDAIDDDDDNDGITDAEDKDDDGDGTPDDKEVRDNDNDGISDDKDADDDNDGTPDAKDLDDDGDGVSDAEDTDDDNDGVADGEDADHDEDGDGTPDAADKDDDNDGVPDAEDHDQDNDGVPDAKDADDDNDGTPDVEDTDDDNDGVDDGEDADHDEDADGTPDAADTDDDGDGVADAEDHDQDNDGVSDDKDADDDNDGIPDAKDDDDDNDGVADSEDADHDNDGDGTPDSEDADDDNDGTPDTADADDDGDGEPDAAESEDAGEEEAPPEEEAPEEEDEDPPPAIASFTRSV